MKQRSKRLLSILLTLVMLLGMVPGVAWADLPEFNGLSSGDTFQSIELGGNNGDATRTGTVTYVHNGADTTASIVFTKCDSDNNLPTESGKYYLTQDVTLNGTCSFNSGANITLCLNGHTIRLQQGEQGPVIIINQGTLNLFDNTTEGMITGGNSTYDGGGVAMGGGRFNMYGGKITGNTAENGSAVSCSNEAEFHMYGGEISDNTARGYGAVYCCGYGELGLSGKVVIQDNTAGSPARPSDVCLAGNHNPKLSLEGPLSQDARIGVFRDGGGDTIVSDYKTYMGDTDPSVYFFSNDPDRTVVSLVEDYGGSYNVVLNPEPAEMNQLTSWSDDNLSHAMQLGYGTTPSGKVKASYREDNDTVETVIFSTELRKAESGEDAAPAIHYLKSASQGDTEGGTYHIDGSYYLTGDLTLDRSLLIADSDVYLDLAGHTLSFQGDDPTINAISYNLYLFDSSTGKTGKVVNTGSGNAIELGQFCNMYMFGGTVTGNTGYGVKVGNQEGYSFRLYGGRIADGKNTGVRNDGTFNMYGGEITENTATDAGGGVFNNGSFTLYNGTISNNTAAENGGGVENNSAAFVMWGGEISGNKATNAYKSGGGVHVKYGTFALRGGRIINNEAASYAGVFMNNADLTISGAPVVKDNKSSDTEEASNIATYRLILVDGALTEGAKLGVTLIPDRNGERFMGGMGVFTTGSGVETTTQATAVGYFFSDEGHTVLATTQAADGVANQLKLDTVPFTRLEKLSITNTTENTRDGSGGESTYPQVGDTLRANATDNSNTPSTPVTYRWYRADSKDGPYTLIEGATEENYTATAADADKFLKVVATQSEDGSGATLTTPVTKEAVIGPVALRNAPTPFQETHPTYPTNYNGQITKTHADVDIENYANLYYSDDNGKTWKKVQTDGNASATNNLPAGTYLFSYRNSDGSLPESKTATVILTATYDLLWLKLTSETEGKKANEVGATVKAVTNFGDSVPAGTSLAYQWYRVKENTDGTVTKTKLEGQTAQTYTIVAEDAGCKVLAEVTWTYDGEQQTKTLSTPTPIIVSEPPAAYSVSGKVEKPTSNADDAPTSGVSNATVELRQGNTVIATATTDEYGNYSFNNTAPNGEYNIVVTTSDGKTTKTERVTVNGANASVNVLLPFHDVSSLIVVQGNTPAVVIGSLDDLAKTESAGISSGQSIEVKLTVEGKEDLTEVSDTSGWTAEQIAEKTDQTDVKQKAKATTGAGTVVEFLNMGIVKATTSGGNSTYQAIRDTGAIVLNIRIPYLTEGRYQFGIYRKHVDDSNHETTIAFQNNSTHGDGTFEVGKGYLDVYATKFSTYAIGYTTTPPNNNNNTTSGGSSDSSSDSYAVTVGQTANGTVKADRSTAYGGSRVTVTATPASGYQVGGVTVTDKNGKTVPVTRNSDGTYRFTMPESAVTVNVSFVRKTANPADTGVSKWLNTVDHILYIRGYNENGVSTVRPDNNITRAEAAMMFYRLLKDQNVTVTKTFTDVSEGQWYAQPIGVLASLGIVGGYGDGTFRPNRTISRAEFAKIATKFATLTGGKAQFSDVPEGHWAGGFIATAADYGWIGGYEDGTYRPESFMTRAAAAKIINYMLGRSADREYVLANRDTLVKYTDLTDPSVWYYFEIVEASVAHDFTVTDGVEKWK